MASGFVAAATIYMIAFLSILQTIKQAKNDRFGLGSLKLGGSSPASSQTSTPALVEELQAAKTKIAEMEKMQLEQAKFQEEQKKELAFFKSMFLKQFPSAGTSPPS